MQADFTGMESGVALARGNCSGAVRSWAGTAPPRAGNGPVLRGMSRPSPSPALMRPAGADEWAQGTLSPRGNSSPQRGLRRRAVQKIAERAVLGSHLNFQKTRFETARLPLRSMARREKRAWQGSSTPGSLTFRRALPPLARFRATVCGSRFSLDQMDRAHPHRYR